MIKKLIVLFLFLPCFLFAQNLYNASLFTSTDTVGSITVPDSVEIQFYDGPWKLLTSSVNDTAYITVDDKVGEVTKIFSLADETYWTRANSMRFRIYATGVDTITTGYIFYAGDGSYTLFIKPDTSGTNTTYQNSWIEGK